MSYIPQIRAIGTKHWYGSARFATREEAQAWFAKRDDVETQIVELPWQPTHGLVIPRDKSKPRWEFRE